MPEVVHTGTSYEPRPLFYGTTGPRNARCIIVGESWGEEENRKREAFVGSSGQELTRMLGEAGIARSNVLCTNVRAEQPPANKMAYFFLSNAEAKAYGNDPIRGLYPDFITIAELQRLHKLISTVRPAIVVGCGNWASWALTREAFGVDSQAPEKGTPTRRVPTGITSWRGSQIATSAHRDNLPYVPIVHPAAILRDWSWRAITVHDLRTRIKPVIDGRPWKKPQYNFILRPDFKTVQGMIGYLYNLPSGSFISCDTECRRGYLACIGFAWSALDAICIPLMCVERQEGYWTLDEEIAIRHSLNKLFSRKDLIFVFQNAEWDFQYFDAEMIQTPSNIFDTMLLHHLIFPGTPKSLDYLSSMYCEFHRYWKDEGREWEEWMPEEQLWNYNCIDSVTAYEIANVEQNTIEAKKLQELAHDRIAQFFFAHEMTRTGCLIDQEEMKKQKISVFEQIIQREGFLANVIPQEAAAVIRGKSAKSPWYHSPIQQMKLFYDLMCFPERIDRRTKSRTMDDEALRQIEQLEPMLTPVTKGLRELRSLGVYYSNILSMELDPDNRARCSYNVAGASTFRFSSSKNAFGRGTNLQNVPKGVDKG